MAKINGNEVRPGFVINHQDRLWVAVKVDHVKPGKGGAYAQVELKAILGGTKLNERFRSAETVEQVELEFRDFTYLYERATISSSWIRTASSRSNCRANLSASGLRSSRTA
jgi:elongation factor P